MKTKHQLPHSSSTHYSRAGDRFHYLWAARRCLKLLPPNSALIAVSVETPFETRVAGEEVIDVGDLRRSENGANHIDYYQLKHSTKRVDKPISFSEFEKTLKGFAALFSEKRSNLFLVPAAYTFWLVSNRLVSGTLKCAVKQIAAGGQIPPATLSKFEKATGLKAARLAEFCKQLRFSDGVGNYLHQERELRFEMAKFAAHTLEQNATEDLYGMVVKEVMPQQQGHSRKGIIYREDVLKIYRVSHESDLFPAPSAFETVDHILPRAQHADLVKGITAAKGHVIIHAVSGVGKTVTAQQLAGSFPAGSATVLYDCYGNGSYMNPSAPRHRPCDALMQIANELAVQGLCELMISHAGKPVTEIFKAFLRRLQSAAEIVSQRSSDGLLVILIDAADNAEMAALSFPEHDAAFPHFLIREELPSNCRVVYLCRPERMHLLEPLSTVRDLPLQGFSVEESRAFLSQRCSEATAAEAGEFHSLTDGNPRVQAYSLELNHGTLRETLDSLGPGGVTVDAQIASQLSQAYDKLRDENPKIIREQMDAICRGLAILPPFIPIKVLAAAAQVSNEDVRSLAADLKRPLRCVGDSVQFRDEPTEKWFKDRFSGSTQDYLDYARAVEPLAGDFAYAARVLPILWHQGGEHEKLIQSALLNEFLPDNPVDARAVRIYRLQHALKASLATKDFVSAAKLSLRAGEEMAGNQRQLQLFRENLDLMPILLDADVVEEWAYKRSLWFAWEGSENLCSASLFAGLPDKKGEAWNMIHSADRWLELHFKALEKMKRESPRNIIDRRFTESDISEIGWVTLHLKGVTAFVKEVSRKWSERAIHLAVRTVCGRLIAAGRFEEVNAIATAGRNVPPLIFGVCHALSQVSKFPPKQSVTWLLNQIHSGKVKLTFHSRDDFRDNSAEPLVSFAEACAFHGLPRKKILTALAGILEKTPSMYMLTSDFDTHIRHAYTRALALKHVLEESALTQPESLLPLKDRTHEYSYDSNDEWSNALRVLGALLPLYELRQKIITKSEGWQSLGIRTLSNPDSLANHEPSYFGSYSQIWQFWKELPLVRFQILALQESVTPDEVECVKKGFNVKNAGNVNRYIEITRIAYRHEKLSSFAPDAEKHARLLIEAAKSPEPDLRIDWLTGLARALLSHSPEDSSAYFAEAVEEAVKFGDELKDGWFSMCSLAKRAAADDKTGAELAHRYFRISELVGTTVDDEGHWSREEVFSVLSKLHAPSAFTCFSRWRERDIGWQRGLMGGFANDCGENPAISPAAAFCLSGFKGANGSMELFQTCIERETRQQLRQKMLDTVVSDLYREGNLLKKETRILETASKYGLNTKLLNELVECAKRRQTPGTTEKSERNEFPTAITGSSESPRMPPDFFDGMNLLTASGISQASKAFDSLRIYNKGKNFWPEMFRRIPCGKESSFMIALVESDGVDYFDLEDIISMIQDLWLDRASVRRHWPNFLKSIGRKLHGTLADREGSRYLKKNFNLQAEELEQIRAGVYEGVESRTTLLHSEALFGFAGLLARKLSPQEARDVLDYSLQPVERHLPSEFGDGPWASWLRPPDSTVDAFAGFIWTALGSPESSVRWQATHCVRRLVELDCTEEISALIRWLEGPSPSAYLGKDFPFYRMEAILHLVLGLSRGSLENSVALKTHLAAIVQLALDSPPHALIRTQAAKLALRIEASEPGVLDAGTIRRLIQAGKSPFPLQKEEFGVLHPSPFQVNRQKTRPDSPYFGRDIEAYWQPGLGRVFGIGGTEVDQLMKEAVPEFLPEHHILDQTPDDPRWNVWANPYSKRRSTHHSHGSYPAIRDLRFYAAFHSMMIAAGKLLQSMPVLSYYGDDDWMEWLSSHSLGREDGRWMSDRRDPTLPDRQRTLVHGGHDDSNQKGDSDDFYDVLTSRMPLDSAICISGHWSEGQDSQREEVRVRCALVRPEMAESLAAAVRTADEPECADLSDLVWTSHYRHEAPFDLTPVVRRPAYAESKLETFDPYLNEMSYPPTTLAESFIEEFQLNADPEHRTWTPLGAVQPVLVCEAWREEREYESDSPIRAGERVCASMTFLGEVCQKLKRSLVVSMHIEDKTKRGKGENDSYTRRDPIASIDVFIIQGTGRVKHTHTHHKLGNEIVSRLGNGYTAGPLARWISHFVAEQIMALKSCQPSQRQSYLDSARTAAAHLQQHDRSLRKWNISTMNYTSAAEFIAETLSDSLL